MACLDQVIAAVGHCRGRRRFSPRQHDGRKIGNHLPVRRPGVCIECGNQVRSGLTQVSSGLRWLDALKSEGTAGGCGKFQSRA